MCELVPVWAPRSQQSNVYLSKTNSTVAISRQKYLLLWWRLHSLFSSSIWTQLRGFNSHLSELFFPFHPFFCLFQTRPFGLWFQCARSLSFSLDAASVFPWTSPPGNIQTFDLVFSLKWISPTHRPSSTFEFLIQDGLPPVLHLILELNWFLYPVQKQELIQYFKQRQEHV